MADLSVEATSAALDADAPNLVLLKGKVSRVGVLKYTPTGLAICEFTVAAPQTYFGKNSIGYFEAQLVGDLAEDAGRLLKVGKKLSLRGTLWARTFRNRQGVKVQETKVLVTSFEEEKK